MPYYTPRAIEPKWQQFWESHKTFRCSDPGDPTVAGKPKVYILDMFPYPSGAGLHVGHPEGYTATDILSRYKRMQGFHVLHPMGWDAFGLPAEQYAVEKNVHPRITTQQNIATFRRQIKSLGFSYDWDREVDTTDPDYVKWTQWIFLQLYDTWYDQASNKGRPISELPIPHNVRLMGPDAVQMYQDEHRLAYQAEVPVNWCPALGTVLANEEVIDGKSERGGHPVERRPLRQWMLRITEYAERLLADLESLDWSEAIKAMQRNWIGKSIGADVDFPLAESPGAYAPGLSIRVFTTRPDTLYGATYTVLAPEHELVNRITTPDRRAAVAAYQEQAARKSDFDRTEVAKAKTGVFTGAYAINPVTNQKIPIWIADYVLASYGTGAIMAVPGHDERDLEFANQFGLPIRAVVMPPDAWLKTHVPKGMPAPEHDISQFREVYVCHVQQFEAFTDDGTAINSGSLNGLPTEEAKAKIIGELEARGIGTKRVNYKLRDWVFSRQRYWGEPFPILHEVDAAGKPTGVIRPLTVHDLPVRLPDLEDFKPANDPAGPLSKATDWVNVMLDGKKYRRETNTMPQWAGSCWYYLRYLDPKNANAFCARDRADYWLPVDLYVGGAEHAVLHLLYSRFWHKVLFDLGHVSTPEPFQRLVNQGMILGENNEKMSKARGNVVNPDDIVRDYGADSLRLYEMFMGPLEAMKPWSTRSVEGVSRFLSRVWRLAVDETAETPVRNATVQEVEPDMETLKLLHKTIKKVTADTEHLRFNTAIAAMMEFTNHLTSKVEVRPVKVLEPFVLLLAPYAPHIAEELWQVLGHTNSLAYEPWPTFDPALVRDDEVEIPVQVNGKIKARLMVPADADAATLEKLALADPKVQEQLAGKTVKKVIAKPRQMVSIVVG